MNNKKYIMIILSVVVIVIFCVIFFTFTNFSDNRELDNTDTDLRDEDIELIDSKNKKIQKLNSYVELNTIRNCIYKFYRNYLYTNNSDIAEKESYQKIVYNMLSKEYIESNNILSDNISSNLNDIEELSIELYEVYTLSQYINNQDEYGNVEVYFCKGIIRDLKNLEGKEFDTIVVLDNINQTFEIYLEDYINYYKYKTLTINEEIDFNIPESIDNKVDNTFSLVSTSMEDIAMYRFNIIKTLFTSDINKAYYLLTDKCKEEFPNIDKFKQFIEDNKKYIYFLTFSSYSIKYDGDILVMDCYDKNDRFCISIYCDEYSTFKYSIFEI